jgi:hypothetical protein
VRHPAPVLALVARQASRIQRQTDLLRRQDEVIETLRGRLRRIQSDVELLGACIPPDKRDMALGLVRDRHRIEDLEEAG